MSPSNPQQPTARLVCNARDEHVEIAVLDGRLREIPLLDNLGMVELDLEPGVYVVQFRSGSEKVERIATLTTPGNGLTIATSDPRVTCRTLSTCGVAGIRVAGLRIMGP